GSTEYQSRQPLPGWQRPLLQQHLSRQQRLALFRRLAALFDHGETSSPKGQALTSVPERDRQHRLVRVHDKYREQLRGLRVTGIGADLVAVAGQFGEALPGLVDHRRSI